jgi:hypothetical protein
MGLLRHQCGEYSVVKTRWVTFSYCLIRFTFSCLTIRGHANHDNSSESPSVLRSNSKIRCTDIAAMLSSCLKTWYVGRNVMYCEMLGMNNHKSIKGIKVSLMRVQALTSVTILLSTGMYRDMFRYSCLPAFRSNVLHRCSFTYSEDESRWFLRKTANYLQIIYHVTSPVIRFSRTINAPDLLKYKSI